ncbi:DNA topoisomerase 2-beta-like [Excalfactoria chinensis]|uniref:DNA topoisomerase 2-beta-like n=1 Tax=Excalfactoria chinensis TaxID=46218 RepID=UPI003B3BABA3
MTSTDADVSSSPVTDVILFTPRKSQVRGGFQKYKPNLGRGVRRKELQIPENNEDKKSEADDLEVQQTESARQVSAFAFSKKKIDDRKEWLTDFMEDSQQGWLHGRPEPFLYSPATTHLTYDDIVNEETIPFSNSDNEGSIPSLVDGLKPGQRKVLFTCFKRNDKREVKVAQLAGSVAEMSAYHYGEQALMMTIVNLAQNFVGSNNVNLLQPIGQFGTRLHGGKDAASSRCIFTMLSPLARLLFPSVDDNLLKFLYDDNQRVEPRWYIPIIPMVLVNGAEGIGTGCACKLPNYDTREIVNNVRRMLDGLDPHPMLPNYKNFRGTIQELGQNQYVVSGEIFVVDRNTVEITELPVRTWTQVYREQVLEPLLNGTEKTPALICDYKEYHTDTTVKFVVKMTEEKLAEAEAAGLHEVFKLQTSLTCDSMVLFDHTGCLKKYETVQDILKEFFDLRLHYYSLRKEWLVGMLGAESTKLNNQARFILEKIQGKIAIENRSKRDLIQMLVQRGYESDPVKAWKEAQEKAAEEEDPQNPNDDASSASGSTSGPDFNYILDMSLWSLTKEKVEELIKHRDSKERELNDLKRKSASDLWKEDLAAFVEELEKVEAQERDDILAGMIGKPIKGEVGKPKMKKLQLEETMPSPFGRRIVPQITSAMKADASRKLLKRQKGDADAVAIKMEFDEEFGGAQADGGGDDSVNTAAPADKIVTVKREKEEPEEEDDADDDANNINDLDELKVKVSPPINDREKEFVLSDSSEEDEYDFPPFKIKPSPEPKYTFDLSEEEDDADDDANNINDLDELKVKACPGINDREKEFVLSDSSEEDEYDFPPFKIKPSPEQMSQEKKNQDFGNIFSLPSYSRKTDDAERPKYTFDLSEEEDDADDDANNINDLDELKPKYTFDLSEEEDDADDDANNKNDLDELKVKVSPPINDREKEFVLSDSSEEDEYDFPPFKIKPSPEQMSQEKKNQDFGNIFSLPSYSRKTDDDTTKLDSDEEDSTPVFSSPFASKETEKILSKTVAAKKAKVDVPPKPKRAPKAKKMETVSSDSDLEFGIPKKTAAPKGKGRGAKKRKASGSENEGDYNPGKKAPESTPCKKPKKAAFDQDSDVEIFQSGFASETAPKPRTGWASKEVKYFAESDEDDDFGMFN